jgi:MEMO1 family protein
MEEEVTMPYVRPPTYANEGWYPDDPQILSRDLERYLAEAGDAPLQSARGVICPHAGYRYCGHVAGATYGQIEVPATVVVLGVDHRHAGKPYSTQLGGSWQLPNGELQIHPELAARIQAKVTILEEDVRALTWEHSLEMQMPFLARRRPDLRFVPIQLAFLTPRETEQAGRKLGEAIREHEEASGERVLLVASSDLHHQEQSDDAHDDRLTRSKDERAIERILAWDAPGLLRRVQDEDITMCGVVPVAMAMVAAQLLGATGARLVRHATSAQIPPHNYGYVVGYGGFIMT